MMPRKMSAEREAYVREHPHWHNYELIEELDAEREVSRLLSEALGKCRQCFYERSGKTIVEVEAALAQYTAQKEENAGD